MSYINLEKLIKSLELSIKSWGADCNSNAPVIVRTYRDVLSRVENIPTADVVEVKHGKWIDTDTFDFHCVHIYQCSYCGREVTDDYIDNHKFCLHCGAKMDGKDEE